MYILPTLPRGGGTAFPISLCLSRIVPANSKSSLKLFQVVKKIKTILFFSFSLAITEIVSVGTKSKDCFTFSFLQVLVSPETLTSRIFPHTKKSILLRMQHLAYFQMNFLEYIDFQYKNQQFPAPGIYCMTYVFKWFFFHHLPLLAQRFWISDCGFEDSVPGGPPV